MEHGNGIEIGMIKIWNEKLSSLGSKVWEIRKQFFNNFIPIFNSLWDEINCEFSATIEYDFKQALLQPEYCQSLEKNISKDLKIPKESVRRKILDLEKGYSLDDATKHNYNDKNLSFLLSEMTMDENLPTPIGVLYKEEKATYEDMMMNQIDLAKEKMGEGDLQKIISGTNTWKVS